MNLDVRWKQRFESFDRALTLLGEALDHGPEALNPLEREGVARRLEYSFELAWKTLKDYLESAGVALVAVTPRHVLKEAFTAKLIADGQVWIDMLNQRNLLSHTYDSQRFEEAVAAIAERYLPAMQALHERLGGEASP